LEIAISYYFLFVRCRKFDAYIEAAGKIKNAFTLRKGFFTTREKKLFLNGNKKTDCNVNEKSDFYIKV